MADLKISAKTFAAIHNDPHLAGTTDLEGNVFYETINFLFSYIQLQREAVVLRTVEVEPQAGIFLDKIRQLADNLEYLAKQSREIEAIHLAGKIKMVGVYGSQKQEMRQEIWEKIDELSAIIAENLQTIIPPIAATTTAIEKVLLPGGWSATPSGHAMIYEFRRTVDGRILFIVHNSGDGLRYHKPSQAWDSEKDRHYSAKIYELSPELMHNQNILKDAIAALIAPQIGSLYDKTSQYNADKLYKAIGDVAIILGGQECDPSAYFSEVTTAGQKSGTCTEKSLHQLLKAAFYPNRRLYKRFIYGFKSFSLAGFIRLAQQNNTITELKTVNQILLAIANMARFLVVNKIHFSAEEIANYQQELAQHRETVTPVCRRRFINADFYLDGRPQQLSTPQSYYNFASPALSEMVNEPIATTLQTEPKPTLAPWQHQQGADVNDEFLEFYEQCNKHASDDLEGTKLQLEALFLQLPLSSQDPRFIEYYLVPDFSKFIAQIGQLKKLYNQISGDIYNAPSPERYVVNLAIITLLLNVSEYRKALDPSLRTYLAADVKEQLRRYVHATRRNPMLASEKYIFDAKLQEIQQIFANIQPAMHARIGFFEQFVQGSTEQDQKLYEELKNKFAALSMEVTALQSTANSFRKEDEEICADIKTLAEQIARSNDGNKSHACAQAVFYLLFLLANNTVNKDFLSAFLQELDKQIVDLLPNFLALKNAFVFQQNLEMEFADGYRQMYKELPETEYLTVKTHYLGYIVSTIAARIIVSDDFERFSSYLLWLELHNLTTDQVKRALIMNQSSKDSALYHANEIQVDNKIFKVGDSRVSLWQRDLFHLRIAAKCQIIASLDYFAIHLDYLKDPSCQVYLFKNIFEPGLLSVALDEEYSVIFGKTQELVNQGLKKYAATNVTLDAIYFIKLAATIYGYALQHASILNRQAERELALDKLNKLKNLINLELQKDPRDANIMRELHQQRFIVIAECACNHVPLTRELMLEYLESLLVVNNYKGVSQKNSGEIRKLEEIIYKMSKIIQHAVTPELQVVLRTALLNSPIFAKILPELGSVAGQSIVGNGLSCTIIEPVEGNEYFIDLLAGNIYKKNWMLTIIPRFIYENKLFKAVFPRDIPSCFCNQTKNCFLLEDEDHNQYRILVEARNKIIIQKKFLLVNSKEWFELGVFPQSYPIIQELNNQFWFNKDGFIIIDRESGNFKYYFNHTTQQLFCLAEKTAEKLGTLVNEWFYGFSLLSFFSAFEDPQFIEIVQPIEQVGAGIRDQPIVVKLVRYQLTMEVTINHDRLPKITLVAQEFSGFQLSLTPQAQLIPGFAGGLLFEKTLDSGLTEQIYLIPKQQFLAREDIVADDEYHQYVLDTGAEANLEYLREYRRITRLSHEDILLRYTDSESFVHFKVKCINKKMEHLKIIASKIEPVQSKVTLSVACPLDILQHLTPGAVLLQNGLEMLVKQVILDHESKSVTPVFNIELITPPGFPISDLIANHKLRFDALDSWQIIEKELIADSKQDLLYLAYLYLGNKQPEQALDFLNRYMSERGGFSGAEAELEMIRFIVDCLPAKIEDAATTASITKPEFIAVKLKALVMLTTFKQNGGVIVAPTPASFPPEDNIAIVKHMKSTENYKFYKNLHSTIQTLYRQYLQTISNVPIQFRLSEMESLNLLRECQCQLSVEQNSIGKAWRRLERRMLQHELDNLMQRQQQEQMPQAVLARIKEIQTSLAKTRSLQINRFVYEPKTVVVELPTSPITYAYYNFKKLGRSSEYFDISAERIFHLLFFNALRKNEDFKQCIAALTIRKDLQDIENVNRFVENFYSYYTLATKSEQEFSVLKAQLANYCRFIIVTKQGSALTDDKKSLDQFMVDLCSLLLIVLRDPTNFLAITASWHYGLNGLTKLQSLYTEAARLANAQQITFTTQQSVETTERQIYQPNEVVIQPTDAANVARRVPDYATAESASSNLTNFIEYCRKQSAEVFSLLDTLQKLEDEFVLQLQTIKTTLVTPRAGQGTLHATSETLIGVKKNELLRLQRTIAGDMLCRLQTRQSIKENAEKFLKELGSKINVKVKELLALANPRRSDPTLQFLDNLTVFGKLQQPLTIPNLTRLYLANDLNVYYELGFTRDDANKLFHTTAEFLDLNITSQQLTRIVKAIDDAKCYGDIIYSPDSNTPDDLEKQTALLYIYKQLSARNLITSSDHPALRVFQYGADLLIREEQQLCINTLLTKKSADLDVFNNIIIQLIMGGGKSKVLLPILAMLSANGTNLSVFEVPEALFNTNFADLNANTQMLFGQPAYPFVFNRETKITARDLKKLYRNLCAVITNKSYLITTAASVQSLELKYIELLQQPHSPLTTTTELRSVRDQQLVEWRKQIKWFGRIIKIFRERGDALLDEVDSNLAIGKQLNYTLSESTPIQHEYIINSTQLFSFFLEQQFTLKGKTITLLGIIADPETIPNRDDLLLIINLLITKLLTSHDSPLNIAEFARQFVKSQEDVIQLLRQYLDQGKTAAGAMADPAQNQAILDLINKLPIGLKNKLAIFKEQLNNVLPLTLRRKLFEHYGASQLEKSALTKKHIAIPYDGCNNPKEKAKFGNSFEIINYTIQMVLHIGLDKELFLMLLNKYLADARNEMLDEDVIHTIDETNAGKELRGLLLDQYSLSQIHIDNVEQIAKLHAEFARVPKIIIKCLQDLILPEIQTDCEILHSNAHNHVSFYRSLRGMTGTPWNFSTMHQSIVYDHLPSLGTDGVTVDLILSRTKDIALHIVDYSPRRQVSLAHAPVAEFLQATLNSIAHRSRDKALRVRAIIDAGPMFRGLSNYEISCQIANFYANSPAYLPTTPMLLFVLFYNSDNQLVAIPVSKSPNPSAIFIGSSDPTIINQKLSCTPNERFTFYDQAHTTGADIKQAINAIAIQTVTKDMFIRDVLQSAMRMRDFAAGQNLEIVVTTETANAIKSGLELPVDVMLQPKHIIAWSDKMQTEQLNMLNFKSALKKISNIIRNDILARILAIADPERQAQFLQKARQFFVSSESENVFVRYGSLESLENSAQVLAQHWQVSITNWTDCLTSFQISREIIEQGHISLARDFDIILQQAAANCPAEVYRQQCVDAEQEVETQLELARQQEAELETQMEISAKKFIAAKFVNWLKRVDIRALGNLATADQNTKGFFHLLENAISAELAGFARDWHFADNIYCSQNFLTTIEDQTTILNFYQNPIHAILMTHTDGKLQAIIITIQEADLICNDPKFNIANLWLATPSGSLLFGTAPRGMPENIEYRRILEQVQFFNGDLLPLATQTNAHVWLNIKTKEKLAFYKAKIHPYRATDITDLILLEERFAIKAQIFKIIYQHIKNLLQQPAVNAGAAFTKLLAENGLEPNTENLDLASRFFAIFDTIDKTWANDFSGSIDLQTKDLIRSYRMPLSAGNYIAQYIEDKKLYADFHAQSQHDLYQALAKSAEHGAMEDIYKTLHAAIYFDDVELVKKIMSFPLLRFNRSFNLASQGLLDIESPSMLSILTLYADANCLMQTLATCFAQVVDQEAGTLLAAKLQEFNALLADPKFAAIPELASLNSACAKLLAEYAELIQDPFNLTVENLAEIMQRINQFNAESNGLKFSTVLLNNLQQLLMRLQNIAEYAAACASKDREEIKAAINNIEIISSSSKDNTFLREIIVAKLDALKQAGEYVLLALRVQDELQQSIKYLSDTLNDANTVCQQVPTRMEELLELRRKLNNHQSSLQRCQTDLCRPFKLDHLNGAIAKLTKEIEEPLTTAYKKQRQQMLTQLTQAYSDITTTQQKPIKIATLAMARIEQKLKELDDAEKLLKQAAAEQKARNTKNRKIIIEYLPLLLNQDQTQQLLTLQHLLQEKISPDDQTGDNPLQFLEMFNNLHKDAELYKNFLWSSDDIYTSDKEAHEFIKTHINALARSKTVVVIDAEVAQRLRNFSIAERAEPFKIDSETKRLLEPMAQELAVKLKALHFMQGLQKAMAYFATIVQEIDAIIGRADLSYSNLDSAIDELQDKIDELEGIAHKDFEKNLKTITTEISDACRRLRIEQELAQKELAENTPPEESIQAQLVCVKAAARISYLAPQIAGLADTVALVNAKFVNFNPNKFKSTVTNSLEIYNLFLQGWYKRRDDAIQERRQSAKSLIPPKPST